MQTELLYYLKGFLESAVPASFTEEKIRELRELVEAEIKNLKTGASKQTSPLQDLVKKINEDKLVQPPVKWPDAFPTHPFPNQPKFPQWPTEPTIWCATDTQTK